MKANPLDLVLSKLEHPRQDGDQWKALCPSHQDRNPSLSIGTGDDGRVLLHCFAGCQSDAIVAALGLRASDLFADDGDRSTTRAARPNGNGSQTPKSGSPRGTVERSYNYVDEEGTRLFQVVRFRDPKGFRQRHRDAGLWRWSLKGVRRVLYRLPEVIAAVESGTSVWVVEGEKDADALTELGEVATTNAGGAKNWHTVPDAPQVLTGADVIVWGDDDEPGHAFARSVVQSIDGKAASWLVVRCAKDDCKDAADHIAHGGDLEQLEVLAQSDADRSWVFAPDAAQEPAQGPSEASGTVEDTGPVSEQRTRQVGLRRGVVCMDTVKPERVSWLWTGRLPRGKISILDGPPGVGKSTLTADLTARITNGATMPDGSDGGGEPGAVVLLSAEDGPGDTIRPRLEAAGANLSKVHLFESVPAKIAEDGTVLEWRMPSIPDDVGQLEDLVHEVGASLVVVDVLMAYLSGDSNSYRDQDVRRALAPLSHMADRAGCAVVLLRHLTKGGSGSAMYRGGGSIGIAGAARSVLTAARHPEDEERFVLAPAKANLSKFAPSLAYRLIDSPEHGCARVEWCGEVLLTADQLVQAESTSDEERTKQQEAMELLGDLLAAGKVSAKHGYKMARDQGISESTLDRARRSLGVVSYREGFGADGVQYWKLPCSSDLHDEHGR